MFVQVPRDHRAGAFRVNSENRDDPESKRLRESANKLDEVLAALTEQGAADQAAWVAAKTSRLLPRPSVQAEALAVELAKRSLEPLRRAQQWFTVDNGWEVGPPRDLQPANLGLPLLMSSSPETVFGAGHLLYARRLMPFSQVHTNFTERLSRLLIAENWLWGVAAKHNGPSSKLPYAYRVQAVEWFGGASVSMCLRCGWIVLHQRTTELPPRCPRCAKEPPAAREWPRHAVAPAERGTWWLNCQAEDCSLAFVGRRNQVRCPSCRTSRTTRSKRKPLKRT